MKRLTASIALATALALSAPAIAGSHAMSPSSEFSMARPDGSQIKGTFKVISGDIVIDEKDLTSSRVNITISTDSIQADTDASTEELKSDKFFNTVEHPEMTFVSKEYVSTGPGKGRVTGDLTLLDVTREVTFDVVQDDTGFTASGTIKRLDFGMSYGQDEIDDDIVLVVKSPKLKN
ncbi:YceI family protein [Minwuia sp.]|uniref:YceI family protein n=1 Tax=Minwuia sp. TaxID=2493630 RepID=UPI003A948DF4